MELKTYSMSVAPRPRRAAAWLLWLAVGLLAGLSSGCDILDLPTLVPTATMVVAMTATPTASAAPEVVISDTGRITLTVWYPDQLAPARSRPGGALAEQYRAFEEMYPDVHITASRFKGRGPGGLLDYLLTTSKVLPASCRT